MRIDGAAAQTDAGRRRLRNEDAFVCEPPLFAIADGMGGAQAGELASRLAAAALEELAGSALGTDAVVDLVHQANTRVYRRSLEDPDVAGMGTTATVILVDEAGGTLAIGHVGDSRAYRLRNGDLEQLTADHSLVAELVRHGRLTEAEAAAHPQRSVITRALGTEPEVEVDTLTVELAQGDLYLLCSDGLTTMLSDTEIRAVVAAIDGDLGRVASDLVDAANRAGGEDNITVVVFAVGEGEPIARERPTRAQTSSPDETTMETAIANEAVPAATSRHGAGHGSRWVALAGLVLVLVIAVGLLYLGITR